MGKNTINFLKQYLKMLGINDAVVDDYTGKILLTVLVKVSEEQKFSQDSLDKYKKVEELIKSGQKEEAGALLESTSKELNSEIIQEAFLVKLFDYLANLTDTIGASLTENSKKQLAGLITSFSA